MTQKPTNDAPAPAPQSPTGDQQTPISPRSRAVRYLWKEWIKPIGAAVLVVLTFKSAVADWYDVPTGSMEPSIIPGDRIGVNKLAYDLKVPFTLWRVTSWGDPARGEVVILLSPKDGTRMVKRVIGLPGDTVAMRDNQLFVNGRAVAYEPTDAFAAPEDYRVLTESLAGHPHPVITHATKRSRYSSFDPVVVPHGMYMMMGDNRDHSLDSRAFGFVPREAILGRAGLVILSLDRENWWKPRWERFFEKLP